jgi:hypothetical protein
MTTYKVITYGEGGWMPEIEGENIISIEEIEVPDEEDVLD